MRAVGRAIALQIAEEALQRHAGAVGASLIGEKRRAEARVAAGLPVRTGPAPINSPERASRAEPASACHRKAIS